MDGPITIQDENLTVFKFYINNGSQRLQVIVWNADIPKFKSLAKIRAILHLDGLYCKPYNHGSRYNKGTEDYELVVQSYTQITVLGEMPLSLNETASEVTEVPLVELQNILESPVSEIKVRGYVKSTFAVIEYKVEVRLPGVIDNIDFKKGDHVEIRGNIQFNAKPIHILMRSSQDGSKVDDKKNATGRSLEGIKDN